MDKLGLRLKYRTQRTTENETVAVEVGYDLSPEWTPLDTATAPGRRTVNLAGSEGRTWEYTRLRFSMRRGADVTKTPVLVYAGLKFVKTPSSVWGIAATIDVTGTRDHLQPRETIALLEALAQTKTLVPTSWRDESGETQVKYMRLTRLVGQELAGPDGRGRWQIGLTEV